MSGFIDLLLETAQGWVVIDYKSFQGQKSDWEVKALSYSGQLDCYRQALAAMNMKTESLWIYFALDGGLVRIDLSLTANTAGNLVAEGIEHRSLQSESQE